MQHSEISNSTEFSTLQSLPFICITCFNLYLVSIIIAHLKYICIYTYVYIIQRLVVIIMAPFFLKKKPHISYKNATDVIVRKETIILFSQSRRDIQTRRSFAFNIILSNTQKISPLFPGTFLIYFRTQSISIMKEDHTLKTHSNPFNYLS